MPHKSIPELKDQYLKGKMSRREFLRYATLLGLSLTAAQSLIAGCAPKPTEVPPTPTPKPTIEALEEAGLRDSVKIMVGGAPVTAAFAEEIGADAYAPDAASAVDVARSLAG